MYRTLKTIVGLIVGAIWGGLIAAMILGVAAYLDDGTPPFGGKGWVIVGVYMGLVIGGVSGVVIGFAIGILSLNKTKGAGVGALVGSIIMVILFLMGAAGDSVISILAVLSIPAGGMVGLISSTFVGWLRNSEKPKSLAAQ
jgi:hypothetical protein